MPTLSMTMTMALENGITGTQSAFYRRDRTTPRKRAALACREIVFVADGGVAAARSTFRV
jgi:hypothetical protein